MPAEVSLVEEFIGFSLADHAVSDQHIQQFHQFQFVFRDFLGSHDLYLIWNFEDYTVIRRGLQ